MEVDGRVLLCKDSSSRKLKVFILGLGPGSEQGSRVVGFDCVYACHARVGQWPRRDLQECWLRLGEGREVAACVHEGEAALRTCAD
jgi:hypothetical protein